MNQEEMISALVGYEQELKEILSRFNKPPSGGLWIASADNPRFKEIVLELRDLCKDEIEDGGRAYSAQIITYYNDSISNMAGSPSFAGVENVKSVVTAALARIRRNPLILKKAVFTGPPSSDTRNPEVLYRIAERFHLVVKQLRGRHDGRATLDVVDEYDVQDLFHALLKLSFDDIRTEEWVPSYAGSASRMDFLLPELEAVVEIKKTRPSLTTKALGEQLIVDIAKYRKHPLCRTLFCFVYDPEGRVVNPRGVENDLNSASGEIAVKVMIAPKGL